MKKRKAFAMLLAVILIALTACGKKANTVSNIEKSTHTDKNEETYVTVEESATVSSEITEEKSTVDTITSSVQSNIESSSVVSAKETTSKKEHSISIVTTHSVVTTLKPTETAHTTKPNITTTKPHSTITSAPTTTEQTFDITYWVSFAKSYARSVGLTLNNEATSCWDNPINANPKSKYLERDIKNALDWYARSGDITEVWIWAEKVGENSYQIYIGYA